MVTQNNIRTGYIKKNPSYFVVGSSAFNLADASESITFDCNQGLEDFASSIRALGERLKIHHFVLNFRFNYNPVINAASTGAFTVQNILALFQLKTSVPLIPEYLYQEATAMHIVHSEGPMVNPVCSELMSELEDGNSPYPAVYSGLFSSATPSQAFADQYVSSPLYNGKPYTSPADTYNCASKPFFLGSNAVAAVNTDRTYGVFIPCCNSSNATMMDPILADTMPAEIFTSASGKALFTISYADKSKIFTDVAGILVPAVPDPVFTPVSDPTLTIELLAYCLFEEDSDPYVHGVTWRSGSMAFNSVGDTVKPDYYRVIYVGLPPAEDYADGIVTKCQVAPFNFSSLAVSPFSDVARVNWNVDGKNVWPSTDRNYARMLFQDWNAGERIRSNPRLYYDVVNNINVFAGTSSSLGSATIPLNGNFQSIQGLLSYCPILPIAYSIPGRSAFAPGFIQMPGTDTTPQIKFQAWNISADMSRAVRAITLSGSENALKQRDVIRYYCMNGSSKRSAGGTGNWIPMIDNPTSRRAAFYSILVPEMCKGR